MNYTDCKIKRYLADAAADKPAPGGGSVSALTGALASSMSEMAANFTVGKEKYADVEDRVRNALKRLELSRGELLTLMDSDVAAYTAVNEAYAMPSESEEEKQQRDEAIQSALKEAMMVPLNIMRQCAKVAEAAANLVEIANRNLLTDVGVSGILAEAACSAARLNVDINVKYLKDQELIDEVTPQADQFIETTRSCRQKIEAAMQDYLSG
jgi:formiminotetrahydrofolate cyclodeaminase